MCCRTDKSPGTTESYSDPDNFLCPLRYPPSHEQIVSGFRQVAASRSELPQQFSANPCEREGGRVEWSGVSERENGEQKDKEDINSMLKID
jgi:hypothetical protein